jgi:hypothetical protein
LRRSSGTTTTGFGRGRAPGGGADSTCIVDTTAATRPTSPATSSSLTGFENIATNAACSAGGSTPSRSAATSPAGRLPATTGSHAFG